MRVFQYQALAQPPLQGFLPPLAPAANLTWLPNNPTPVKPVKDFMRVIRPHTTGFGLLIPTAATVNVAMWHPNYPNPVMKKRAFIPDDPQYIGAGITYPSPASAENPAMWHTNAYLPVRNREGRQAYLMPGTDAVIVPGGIGGTVPAPETISRPIIYVTLTYPDVPRMAVNYPDVPRMAMNYPDVPRIPLRGSNP